MSDFYTKLEISGRLTTFVKGANQFYVWNWENERRKNALSVGYSTASSQLASSPPCAIWPLSRCFSCLGTRPSTWPSSCSRWHAQKPRPARIRPQQRCRPFSSLCWPPPSSLHPPVCTSSTAHPLAELSAHKASPLLCASPERLASPETAAPAVFTAAEPPWCHAPPRRGQPPLLCLCLNRLALRVVVSYSVPLLTLAGRSCALWPLRRA